MLNAQTRARGVYRAAGYAEAGDTFMEAGIEHIRMEKRRLPEVVSTR